MTQNVRLLIVEDDLTERDSWNIVIETHNAGAEEQGFSLRPEYADSVESALTLIEKYDFDAAIVDIRLRRDDVTEENQDGNQVIEKLLESELAIIAAFTGDLLISAKPPEWAGDLVKTFRKGGDDGEGTLAVMAWLTSHFPMISHIKHAKKSIKDEMVKLFFRSIWPRWQHWINEGAQKTEENLKVALQRHLASHVQATLLEEVHSEGVHPEEWYFIPPIHEHIRTGDILKTNDDTYEIVITPRCDLSLPVKITTVLLAKCYCCRTDWLDLGSDMEAKKEAWLTGGRPEPKGAAYERFEKAAERFRKFMDHNDRKNSVHFLPQIRISGEESVGPFMVSFEEIRSAQIEDAKQYQAIASLTMEFLPSLVERLGNYFSRIGTPNYSHPE